MSPLLARLSPFVAHLTPRQRYIAAALLAAYAVYTGVAALFHEPWRDEADTWLIGRDEGVVRIVKLLAYSGTPGLWYLLTTPLAKIGLPYASQFVLHWLLAVLAVAVILFAVRAPLWVRALLVCNGLVAYEYAVVARTYVLSILLLAVIVALYDRRAQMPKRFGLAVLLLANTNVPGLFLALGLGASGLVDLFAQERRRAALVWGTMAAVGAALAVAQLWPPADGQNAAFVPHPVWPVRFFIALTGGVVPYAQWPETAKWAAIACAVATLVAVVKKPQAVVFLLSSYGLFFYLFTVKHLGEVRHHAFLLVALFVALGLARGRLLRPAAFVAVPLLATSLALWTVKGFETWRLEIAQPFSSAEEMGAVLASRADDPRQYVGFQNTITESVLPWAPGRKLWYPQTMEFGTHMEWNAKYVRGFGVRLDEALRRTAAQFPQWTDPKNGVVLLLTVPWPQAEQRGFRLVHATQGVPFRAKDERYWLYEPKPAP